MVEQRSIFLVAGRATRTNDLLLQAFRRLGATAARLDPLDAPAPATTNDAVLGRLDVLPTLDGIEAGLDVLAWCERRGFDVLNHPSALLAAHDKLQTAIRLGQAGVPHPRTAHVDEAASLPALGFPVVVKPRFGSWGRDVVLCRTDAELDGCLRRLRRRTWFRRQGALVQELVRSGGRDLRVVVAGGVVVGAIERLSAPGDWRTNVALGGVRRRVDPPPEAVAAALAAVAAVGGDLVGVDLLPLAAGGWTVLELNGAVDFTEEYSLDGGNVFDAASALLLPEEARLPAAVESAELVPTGV
jgi:RimK family alpha-L-glutamate ligase